MICKSISPFCSRLVHLNTGVAVFAVAALFSSPSQKMAQADPPSGTGSTWSLKLEDQFNSHDMNIWRHGYAAFDGGYHNSAWRGGMRSYMPDAEPSQYNSGRNVTFSNGNMIITAKKEAVPGGGTFNQWTTGQINSATRREYKYGYFEIRGKFTSPPGNDPGFWLFNSGGGWRSEIDILEVPGRSWGNEAQVNVHWRDANDVMQNAPASVDTDTSNYHTYAALWDREKVIFYRNGREIHRVVGRSPQTTMYLNVANEINGGPGDNFYGDPLAGVFPNSQSIDYVKVWQYNGGDVVTGIREYPTTDNGGTISIPTGGENPHNANERRASAFDNRTDTKWLYFGTAPNRSGWIQFNYPSGVKKVVRRLALTAAAGNRERDPKIVRVYGVADNGAWIGVTGDIDTGNFRNLQRKVFDFGNNTAYKAYVLEIRQVRDPNTATACQVAEVEFSEMY